MGDWHTQLLSVQSVAGAAGGAISGIINSPYVPHGVFPEMTYLEATVQGVIKAFWFDCVMQVEHATAIRKTSHPLQNGANISDHAFVLPARVTLTIGMSDSMASIDLFIPSLSGILGIRDIMTPFSDRPSRSVSAYQTLEALKNDRVSLTLVTRLQTYENMLIEQIGAVDDYTTKYALKAHVLLEQVRTATLATATVSAKPMATDNTNKGTVQAKPVEQQPGLVERFEIQIRRKQ